MTPPIVAVQTVLVGVASILNTVVGSVIGGVFLIVNTLIAAYFVKRMEGRKSDEKTHRRVTSDTDTDTHHRPSGAHSYRDSPDKHPKKR